MAHVIRIFRWIRGLLYMGFKYDISSVCAYHSHRGGQRCVGCPMVALVVSYRIPEVLSWKALQESLQVCGGRRCDST